MNVLAIIARVLGLGNGGSAANTVGGVVNYATLVSLGGWAWVHRNEEVTFTVSVGFLCLVAGAAVFIMELMRRSNPNTPTQPKE